MIGKGRERRPQASPRDPRWAGGRARGDGGREMRSHWIVAAGWNVLAVPLAVAWWTRRGTGAWPPVLDIVLPLFVAVGPLLLGQAIVALRRWHRFEDLELVLDPFPGSLGGHVGGSVEVPGVRPGDAPDLTVTLTAVHRTVSGGTSRRDRRRWESVLWSRIGRPRIESAPQGVRLRFTFQVPRDLPPSEEEGDDRVFWVVRVHGPIPGADLDRVFEVPVLATPDPILAASPAPADDAPSVGDGFHPTRSEPGAGLRAVPPSVARVRAGSGGVTIEYRRLRGAPAGLAMVAFGTVFSGSAWFAFDSGGGWRSLANGDFLSAAVTALLAGGFGGLGLLLVGLGLYTALNRLTVEITPDRIRTTRSILLQIRREAPTRDIERVALAVSGQVGQGARAEVTYRIRARLVNGKEIPLGDGIRRSVTALTIARLVSDVTSIEVVEAAEDVIR